MNRKQFFKTLAMGIGASFAPIATFSQKPSHSDLFLFDENCKIGLGNPNPNTTLDISSKYIVTYDEKKTLSFYCYTEVDNNSIQPFPKKKLTYKS